MLFAIISICGYAQIIDPVLIQEMGRKSDDEKIKVIVIMKSQYDRQQLGRRSAAYANRAERREFVVNELKQFCEASQYDLRRSLDEMESHDMTTSPRIIWMANALYFSATKQAINDLAMRRDIELIGLDEKKQVLFDEEPKPANNTRGIAPNVTQVNADQVWNMGYTGQGVVVAVIDTGVNYNHLDLADHLWDGGAEYPNHGYDFCNDDDNPMDDNGHGTHCAGTVCGDGTAGQQTGMAPDATLMCVKAVDSVGFGYASATCNAMQWVVEQGCDLFSMSLGWEYPTHTERMLFRNTCVAILDAGVIGTIAAGNSGDWNGILYNVGTPGSCPPPYMDPVQGNNPGGLSCVVCVGAVDYNDEAADFSSRGPVRWSDTEFGDYPYTEGSITEFGLIRPDVCAPGVDIISADYSGNSGYVSYNGTSMATPCVAGCISLLLSKDINASPGEICQVLEETAESLDEGKSNTYGFGRVNALAAINALHSGPLMLESFVINDEQGNNDGKLNAGETVTLDLTLLNDSDNALDGATMVLSTTSEYITFTDGAATLPYFDAGQAQTVENIFVFTLNDDAPVKREIQFVAETFIDGEAIGIIRFSVIIYGHSLKLDEVTVLNDDNGNGLLDAGETADLHVVISNIGNESATSIVGTLSSVFPSLTINDATVTFGDVGIDGQTSAEFNVALSDDAPEIYIMDFSLDLIDDNEKHTGLDFELMKGIIAFADPIVKSICVSHWDTDGDGELSYDEAEVVTDLYTYFQGQDIVSFDELQFFTGLSAIDEYAFDDCGRLTSITIPNSVTSIGNYAFYWCIELTSIMLPDSITSIGEGTFTFCLSLESIMLPDSVTSIGDSAFSFCVSLTSITIPNSVTTIGDSAFSDCIGLNGNLVIPNSVTSIGDDAFYDCNSIASVIMLSSTVPSLGNEAFSGTDANYYIYVPYPSFDAYKTAANWNDYEHRIFPMAYAAVPGYGNGDDKWVFISSPLRGDIVPEAIDNMLLGTNYDLYQFNQSATDEEWQNYKTDNFNLVNGHGYVYANEVEVNVIFKGVFNEDETKVVSLDYDAEKANPGWNLIGNPFPVDAYIDRPYYVMNEDGTSINPVAVPASTPIPPCVGVLVKANGTGESVTFSRSVSGTKK